MEMLPERFRYSQHMMIGYLFRLHYAVTCPFLFVAAVIGLLYRLNRTVIDCKPVDVLYAETVSAICSYTGNLSKTGDSDDSFVNPFFSNGHVHYYYSYVDAFLWVNGLVLYIPYCLWKTWNNDRLEVMLYYIEDCSENDFRLFNLIQDTITQTFWFRNCSIVYTAYHCTYILVNTIYWVSSFILSSMASDESGWDRSSFSDAIADNPTELLSMLFPDDVSCTFIAGGQVHVSSCHIFLNVAYKMFFTYLLRWYSIMSVLGMLHHGFELLYVLSSHARERYLIHRFQINSQQTARVLARSLSYDQFVVVRLLCGAMDPEESIRFLRLAAETL